MSNFQNIAAKLREAGFRQLEFVRGADIVLANGKPYKSPDEIWILHDIAVFVERELEGAAIHHLMRNGFMGSALRSPLEFDLLLQDIWRAINYFGERKPLNWWNQTENHSEHAINALRLKCAECRDTRSYHTVTNLAGSISYK